MVQWLPMLSVIFQVQSRAEYDTQRSEGVVLYLI